MVWNKCSLKLNTGLSGTFSSGDVVTGCVVIDFNKKRNIEYLTLEILGETEVQWTRPSPTTPFIRNYHQKKRLLHIQLNLDVSMDGQTQPGAHERSFVFTLPQELPSSFEGSCGWCRYWAQLTTKAPYSFKKKELVPFTVVTKVNLNHLPHFVTPTYHQLEKRFLSSGGVRVAVCTHTGFAPGQRVPCRLVISNNNRAAISKVRISLIQKITYNASSGYADEEKRICSAEAEKQRGRSKTAECTLEMEIPQCAPSTHTLAEPLIAVAYVIRVEMRFPYHLTMAEDIPAIVTSVPVPHSWPDTTTEDYSLLR